VEEVRPRFVFHLAAETIVQRAEHDPGGTFETNVRGTYHLLDACARTGTVRGVVVASSDKAYGVAPQLPYTEDMPLRATSVYECSKVAAEYVARGVAARAAIPLAITRCSNLYGPGDLHFSRIVPGVCAAIARGEQPVIRGSGEHTRDFLHVSDAVRGYLCLGAWLADNPDASGEPFNFGSGRAISVRALVALLLELAGGRVRGAEVRGVATPVEITHQCVDASKAYRTIHWTPMIDLREGMRETLDWYCRDAMPVPQ
jgi:CDP-glucose 4,6-dehydratase